MTRNWIAATVLLLTSMGTSARCIGADKESTGHDAKPIRLTAVEHVPVYDVDGRFGGWPANHGIWSWGNEILVGFGAGYYKDLGPERHNIDRERPEEHLLARSLDGGETWSIEYPARQGVLIGTRGGRHGTLPTEYKERPLTDCPGGINFAHPDFAMTCRMSGADTGESRFYYSYDRGKTWQGPFRLPMFGQPGIAARTDYIVNTEHDCLVFLTASKQNNSEGRPICVRTTDGGKSWALIAVIGPEPKGIAIMPSTIRLGPDRLLTTIRMHAGTGEPRRRWIDAWASDDDGKTWTFLDRPVPDTGEGNPPHLILLSDGRGCLTYGYRAKPFGIMARLTDDGGKTWGPELIIRDDGAGRDIGYPRTVQRRDGKIVTLYYFFDAGDVDRKIIASIWSPPAQ